MPTKTHRDPFIQEVRAGLARKGATQTDLAAHLRISRGQITRRLTGEVAFGHTEVAAIAEYLDVSVEDLYARSGTRAAEVAS